MPKSKSLRLRMRIRVYLGDTMIGPGKVELLAHIAAKGSLSEAARQMGMSYMRAWTLVRELNRDPKRRMVKMSRGGARGGTAQVTPLGKEVVTLYQLMERNALRAARLEARKLSQLLRSP